MVRPGATEQLDLECELAVVIGRRAKSVDVSEALEHVFGYTILNDASMRELQAEEKQWLRAKRSDGLAPIGPVVVSREELPDPHRLRIRSGVLENPVVERSLGSTTTPWPRDGSGSIQAGAARPL